MEWSVTFLSLNLQRPDGDKAVEIQYRQLYNLPRVSGVIRPFPDQQSGSLNIGLTLNDVNSETYRQQIIANCWCSSSF